MNKSQQKLRAKQILNRHNPGDVITDPIDLDFLLHIFSMHEHYEYKAGVGIANILITKALYNTKCFAIQRVDGTITDISYNSCFKKTSKIENVKKACRYAIDKDVTAMRLTVTPTCRCPFTDELLLPDNVHIDHYDLKFSELFALWLKDKDVDSLYLKTNHLPQDMNFATHFTDPSIAEDFRQFHNTNTHLRAVSKRANLSLLK